MLPHSLQCARSKLRRDCLMTPTFGFVAQFGQSQFLNLANAFACYSELRADLIQSLRVSPSSPNRKLRIARSALIEHFDRVANQQFIVLFFKMSIWTLVFSSGIMSENDPESLLSPKRESKEAGVVDAERYNAMRLDGIPSSALSSSSLGSWLISQRSRASARRM